MNTLVCVSHDGCPHTAEAWNLALSAALSHSGKTMNPQSREPVIRKLMRGQTVTHQKVRFTGKLVAP
jgi:hypothetical protein